MTKKIENVFCEFYGLFREVETGKTRENAAALQYYADKMAMFLENKYGNWRKLEYFCHQLARYTHGHKQYIRAVQTFLEEFGHKKRTYLGRVANRPRIEKVRAIHTDIYEVEYFK